MLLDTKSKVLLNIERACNELRKGFAVIVNDGADNILAVSPETISKELLSQLFADDIESINLIISANRLKYLDSSANLTTSSFTITKDQQDIILQLCGLENADGLLLPDYKKATKQQEAALKLAKIAEIMPCIITLPVAASMDISDFTRVDIDNIKLYQDLVSYEIKEACRTNLVLKHNIDAQIVAYRPNIGGKEHYAIIIGSLVDAPLVRIHSSCYTGDLLDSLACDCHDQLHSAIDIMHAKGGGIILYMLQEGRGIGLINKLRAYVLKEQGFDTVDANESLGFDDDERLFEPAAQILKQLQIDHVQLLTNNPRKASGLEQCGIKVIECVPHIMDSNEHNEQYLKTKSTRLGHMMDE